MQIYLSTEEEKLVVMVSNYTLKKGENRKVGSVLNIIRDDIDGEIDSEDMDVRNEYVIDEEIGKEKIIVRRTSERTVRLR